MADGAGKSDDEDPSALLQAQTQLPPAVEPPDDVTPEEPADTPDIPDEPVEEEIFDDPIITEQPTETAEAEEAKEPPADIAENLSAVDQVAEAIIADALARAATAIHLEMVDGEVTLRLRIGGVLREKTNFKQRLPRELGTQLIEYFRSLAGVSEEIGSACVGEFKIDGLDRMVQIKLSTVRRRWGSGVVMRIFDRREIIGDEIECVESLLSGQCGLVLVACPPRNPAKRILRAIAGRLSDQLRSVMYVERSADYRIDGVTQCLRDRRGGFDWPQALRTSADQDADVILVEDIYNPAAIDEAIDAVCDGRSVIAGIRADSAAGGFDMLKKMDVDSWELASVLKGVIVPRTIRTLCDECKKRVEGDAGKLAELGLAAGDVDFPLYEAAGCPRCSDSGYASQATLLTIRKIDESTADLIRNNADATTIAGQANISFEAIKKLRTGETSLKELLRAIE